MSFSSGGLYFVENKGQLHDQNGKARSDIAFYASTNNFSIFVGSGQVHYQLKTAERPAKDCGGKFSCSKSANPQYRGAIIPTDLDDQYATSRVDVSLRNSDPNAKVIYSECKAYSEHYYLSGAPVAGIHAASFRKVTIKNVYPDIDWVFYIKGTELEYEFVVGPAGDVADISLQYSGALATSINEQHDLRIVTPIGEITEHAPLCYKTISKPDSQYPGYGYLSSGYHLQNNVLTYDIEEKNSLVIDPGIAWGTYFGEDSSVTVFYGVTTDKHANIIAAGKTFSTGLVATSGSFQDVIGGDMDAFLVKFDSSGNRIWATYYGSDGSDWAAGVQLDTFGHIFIGGCTNSTSGIVTPGCQQPVYGGGSFNGFLAMFDTSGVRHWCTYLGGTSATEPDAVCTDYIGHVYVTGLTNDGTNISTPGSCQPSPGGGHDLCLVQYDTTGARIWGTYYGGPSDEFRGDVATDFSNNVFLSGWTSSTSGIATATGYQHVFGGVSDAFLVKFNSSGARQWGTYYGGPASENTGGLTVDIYGFIYLLGNTSSDAGVASPGCYQPLRGGLQDAFIAKFENAGGTRLWGTYYGGPGDENTDYSKIVSDSAENVYITGTTTSTSGLVSTGIWQTFYGGGDMDGFVAKYNGHGIQQWSSYLGGEATDQPFALAYDGKNAYVCGTTNSTTNIATPGSFLPTGGGLTYYNQGFMVKISDYIPTAIPSLSDSDASFLLYPSPNDGTFAVSTTLSRQTSETVKITVSDLAGKTVYQNETTAVSRLFSCEVRLNKGLPNGIYILKLMDQEGVRTTSFTLTQ